MDRLLPASGKRYPGMNRKDSSSGFIHIIAIDEPAVRAIATADWCRTLRPALRQCSPWPDGGARLESRLEAGVGGVAVGLLGGEEDAAGAVGLGADDAAVDGVITWREATAPIVVGAVLGPAASDD